MKKVLFRGFLRKIYRCCAILQDLQSTGNRDKMRTELQTMQKGSGVLKPDPLLWMTTENTQQNASCVRRFGAIAEKGSRCH